MILLLNIGALQSISFTLILKDEEARDDDRDNAEASKDGHRWCVVDDTISLCVALVNLTNPHRYKGETNVLDVEDKSVSSSEQLYGDDFGHRGPHG